MRCPRCGIELQRPGQGHTCRSAYQVAAEPPTRWVVATWLLLGCAGVFALTAAAVAAIQLAPPARSAELTPAVMLISLAWLASSVGTVGTVIFWNRETRRTAELYGADATPYTRYWFFRLYSVTVIVTLYMQWGLGASARTVIIAGAVIRIAAGLLVITSVLIGRARILALIADSVRQSTAAQHLTATHATPAPAAIPQPFASPTFSPDAAAASIPVAAAGPNPWPENEPWPEIEPWPDPNAAPRTDSPVIPIPPPRSRRPRASTALTTEPGDWDAHQWDTDTQRDILRRRDSS